MPSQIERVTDSELADIEQWIRDGAQNNAFFNDKVAPVFGTEVTLGRHIGKCTLCHYPGSFTRLNVLTPFDPQVGLVGVESFLSADLRVEPGSPDKSFLIEKLKAEPSVGSTMPLQYQRLNDNEIEILRKWIAQGANDD
jgi:hypothetical protein